MEETDQFPSEVVKKMGQYGLMGIPIETKWDGAGSDFLSYIIASPIVSFLSYQLLHSVGGLQQGESVLIHLLSLL